MAAGASIDTQGFERPLAERWNGGHWTLTAAVPAGTGLGAELLGVSCVSPTACVAVGDSEQIGHPDPIRLTHGLFAERLNGTRWTLIPPRIGISGSAAFTSVSCSGASACTAVGTFGAVQADPLPSAPVTSAEDRAAHDPDTA
jgi:hypothetical protein